MTNEQITVKYDTSIKNIDALDRVLDSMFARGRIFGMTVKNGYGERKLDTPTEIQMDLRERSQTSNPPFARQTLVEERLRLDGLGKGLEGHSIKFCIRGALRPWVQACKD